MNVLDRYPRSSLVVIFCLVLGATMVMFAAMAHAGTDSVADATAAVGTSWDIVQHQGLILGPLLLINGLARYLLKANESAHWLAQGKTLAIVTGVMMVVGAALDWKVNGGPSAGVITALFAAIPLVMHSTVTQATGGAS